MIDLKNLRRDLDIQSEMKRSSAPGIKLADSDDTKPETRELDTALSAPAMSPAEARGGTLDARDGEGSVGYRIAIMVAMFLLALVTMLIWYYKR
jgi:hypothetical protein